MMADNQWPVNYNWDVASFEPHIRGVRNLMDFVHASPRRRRASLFFLSSVATVSSQRQDDGDGTGAVPEAPSHRYLERASGYAASKHVAELLLEQEVAAAGLGASFCRVGQIAGPVLRGKDKGMWPKHEWLPSVCGILTPAACALSRPVTSNPGAKGLISSGSS
jgi:thioester reductase-like protein